jgi:hypothetical protein
MYVLPQAPRAPCGGNTRIYLVRFNPRPPAKTSREAAEFVVIATFRQVVGATL